MFAMRGRLKGIYNLQCQKRGSCVSEVSGFNLLYNLNLSM